VEWLVHPVPRRLRVRRRSLRDDHACRVLRGNSARPSRRSPVALSANERLDARRRGPGRCAHSPNPAKGIQAAGFSQAVQIGDRNPMDRKHAARLALLHALRSQANIARRARARQSWSRPSSAGRQGIHFRQSSVAESGGHNYPSSSRHRADGISPLQEACQSLSPT
jgi:hypothetical protein